VGAAWHTLAYDRGPLADRHRTPVGVISGAEMHADFAEAMEDSRSYHRVSWWVQQTLEWLIALSAAVLFLRYPGRWAGAGVLVGVTLAMVLIEWVTLHLFGVFLEIFIPVFALYVHSVMERVLPE
jgi:hypothetical protein